MTLLKFSASWCNPCGQLTKIIRSIPQEELPFDIHEIDIDKEPGMAALWKIRSIPTLILVDETGEELKRSTGALTKDQLMKFLGDTI